MKKLDNKQLNELKGGFIGLIFAGVLGLYIGWKIGRKERIRVVKIWE